jgi:hypothetical protein
MMWRRLNINARVRVVLTERGRNIYDGAGYQVPGDGVVSLMLWDFMRIFGPHFRTGFGYGVTVNNEIEIEED